VIIYVFIMLEGPFDVVVVVVALDSQARVARKKE